MKVTTNLKEVLEGMTAKLFSKENLDNTMRTVATTALASMQTRIYEQGKKSDGSQIGKYSIKPLYVSGRQNPGRSFGAPVGKTGRSKFQSGKKAGQNHVSKYFAGGYDEFKRAIGRNPGYVNLSLSGQLNSQMSIVETANGFGIGWADSEKFKRAQALENKYGKIYSLTDQEKQQATETAQKEFFKT